MYKYKPSRAEQYEQMITAIERVSEDRDAIDHERKMNNQRLVRNWFAQSQIEKQKKRLEEEKIRFQDTLQVKQKI